VGLPACIVSSVDARIVKEVRLIGQDWPLKRAIGSVTVDNKGMIADPERVAASLSR